MRAWCQRACVVFPSFAGLVVSTWSGCALPGAALLEVAPGVAFGGLTLCSDPVLGGAAEWPLAEGAVEDCAKAAPATVTETAAAPRTAERRVAMTNSSKNVTSAAETKAASPRRGSRCNAEQGPRFGGGGLGLEEKNAAQAQECRSTSQSFCHAGRPMRCSGRCHAARSNRPSRAS